MKYDDIIELARTQDPGPHPGPDFMALMAASTPPQRRRAWPWVAAGVVAAAAASVLLWGGIGSMLASPDEASEPSQAIQQASPAEREGAVAQPGAKAGDPPLDPAPSESVEPEPAQPDPAPEPTDVQTPAREPSETVARSSRPRPSLDAEQLYRRAEAHMAAGRLGAARDDLRRVVRRFPDYGQRAAAWIDWARVEERLGHPQRAACEYAAFLRRFSDHALASDARKARQRLLADPKLDDARCR